MRTALLILAVLATTASCARAPSGGDSAEADSGNGANPASAVCAVGEKPLPLTGLCPGAAEKLLLTSGSPVSAAMPGCDWIIRETSFATDVLLYRAMRCGKNETAVEFQVGNHESNLVYVRSTDGLPVTDADNAPIVLARVYAGDPDGRARAQWETRDSMQNPKAALRCELKAPYHTEGLPADALIVDIKRSQADLDSVDAIPECGPLGYNPAGGSVDFWRTHQGYAWFFHMGTDVWDVDPGSFTIITKGASGKWETLPQGPA